MNHCERYALPFVVAIAVFCVGLLAGLRCGCIPCGHFCGWCGQRLEASK